MDKFNGSSLNKENNFLIGQTYCIKKQKFTEAIKEMKSSWLFSGGMPCCEIETEEYKKQEKEEFEKQEKDLYSFSEKIDSLGCELKVKIINIIENDIIVEVVGIEYNKNIQINLLIEHLEDPSIAFKYKK